LIDMMFDSFCGGVRAEIEPNELLVGHKRHKKAQKQGFSTDYVMLGGSTS